MEYFAGKENKEEVKGTIGFDFIFHTDEEGNKKVYCIEINGHSTGVIGMKKLSLEDRDLTAKIYDRTVRDPKADIKHRSLLSFKEKFDKTAPNDLPDLTYSAAIKDKINSLIHRSILGNKVFNKANKNPVEVEDICSDKNAQENYIPEENRVESFKTEKDVLESDNNLFILKPRRGISGRDIKIYSKESMLRLFNSLRSAGFDRENLVDIFFDKYVVQKFIQVDGAETLGQSDFFGSRPASLRLLLDFHYSKSGEVVVDDKYIYQRVSPFSRKEDDKSAEAVSVVNLAKGAEPYIATKSEEDMVYPVALQILENLKPIYLKK